MKTYHRASAALSAVVLASAQQCRDRFLWPFSNTSIWNTPIGSGAVFTPANIYTLYPPPQSFHNDEDFNLLTTNNTANPSAPGYSPLTPWINQGDWSGGNKCAVTGTQATTIPFPYNFTTTCTLNNNAAGILMPDNRTLVQLQPLYRESPGSPILARYHSGAPQPFPWTMDILGEGAEGAHGGSGLSSFGGTIRSGELQPDAPPIAHALKLELYAHQYYYGGAAAPCYRWPAVGCDSYAHSGGGMAYNGSNPELKPGALLAIPAAVAPGVVTRTTPGAKVKAALVTYGGYLVDDTACDTAAICMEAVVTAQVRDAYGFSVDISDPVSPTQGGDFYADLVAIFQALHVVSNNANSSIGGGGTPLGPIAPPICGA